MSAITVSRRVSLRQHTSHPRDWRENLYVYPVISRRSGGLSIGINLNPDTACNFDCIYCQVDRTQTPRIREVDPAKVHVELERMISAALSGELFTGHEFGDVPAKQREIRDIAFSGDGEPTTCRDFRECVELVSELRQRFALADTKLVLITDACYLTKPDVAEALRILDENNGEIWAKLDAGTDDYYRTVNRPNVPLRHVLDNIIAAASVRPIVIQSLFMRIHEAPPPQTEIAAFADRLNEIQAAGGKISYVQVYTVARPPAVSFVTPLSDAEVDDIATLVRLRTGLQTEVFYGHAAVEE